MGRGEAQPARHAAGRWRVWLATLAVIAAVALAGMALTDLGPWYASLRQPSWKPDDRWFGPAWTLVYATTAAAFVRRWRALPSIEAPDAAAARRHRRRLLGLYLGNAAVNVAWSAVFFQARRPDAAVPVAVLLWLSVAALVREAARRDRTAAALLLPYLGWTAFAAVLNAAVALLNRPF